MGLRDGICVVSNFLVAKGVKGDLYEVCGTFVVDRALPQLVPSIEKSNEREEDAYKEALLRICATSTRKKIHTAQSESPFLPALSRLDGKGTGPVEIRSVVCDELVPSEEKVLGQCSKSNRYQQRTLNQ